MRVNIIAWTMGRSGGPRIAIELANRLIQRGHSVTITALRIPLRGPSYRCKANIIYVNDFISFGLSYIIDQLKLTNSYAYWLVIKSLIAHLTKAIPDCDVNIATFWPTAFAAYQSSKGKIFYYVGNDVGLYPRPSFIAAKVEESYFLPLHKIASSIFVQQIFRDDYGFDIPVVPPGVDRSIFVKTEVERDPTVKRVMCYAYKYPIRRFIDIYTAMRLVLKKIPAKLVMVGPHHQKLDIPHEHYWVKSDQEIAKLYSSSDVFVNVSLFECPGLMPLEAMSCGTPVIVTPNVGRDYVVNEYNALVVPLRDPVSLAKAILRVIENEELKKELSKGAEETAKKFSWDMVAKKLEVIITT